MLLSPKRVHTFRQKKRTSQSGTEGILMGGRKVGKRSGSGNNVERGRLEKFA